ncbi:YHS domain-containing (seleno)protein [Engelhardtia mirabilis]|uniref:YHS domain protein n=1 Tax=Engelhardtia mirabilis TaxID=2528011 RepID=A0A518BIM2_9BACT|nr:YHS domain protein [Planctomycetes bacterium Pla133]QDV01141.1 YHS domain protein [Planctomycetes bacterium Pla86]
MRSFLAALFLGAFLTPFASAVQGDEARPAIDQYNLGRDGLALQGYDPVAYYEVGGGSPTKGDKQFSAEHRGVTYRFASDANRQLFLAAPARFEPAYGGWCAYAMASGDKTDIDPKSFLIEEGRLLVFYNGFFGNTRKSWGKEQGPVELRPKADQAWREFSGEAVPRSLREFDLQQGLALKGIDPVSIATGTPVAGLPRIAVVERGVTYYFATEANAAAFRANPAAHEPAFGGWCARAMAEGKKVAVDPRFFVAESEQLLLFAGGNARQQWIDGGEALAARAEAAWTKLNAPVGQG